MPHNVPDRTSFALAKARKATHLRLSSGEACVGLKPESVMTPNPAPTRVAYPLIIPKRNHEWEVDRMGVDPFFSDHWTRIYQGDALEILRGLEANSVHAVVTSPP